MTADGQIWVGILEDEGPVVFDPRRQNSNDRQRAILWSSTDQKFSGYYKDMVKKYLTPTSDPILRESILGQYEDFLAHEIEINHKNRLEELGIKYTGTSVSSKRHRATHCYNCKNNLDNSIDIECNTCGWILCSCGACGCGYDA